MPGVFRSTESRRRGAGLLPLALFVQAALAADPAKLASGSPLPPLEAQTLAGDPAALPRDAQGHGAVLVVGFTKAAAKVTGPWLEACRAAAAARPAESGLTCFDVRMVEDVPHMFRGAMEHGMKSGFPAALQRQTLLVYANNDAWRKQLGVADTKTAYLIGCDAQGVVRGLASGPYAEPELRKLLEASADPGTAGK